MKRLISALTVTLIVLAGQPAGAAGILDHLLCYRTQDPLKIQSAADLLAELQPEFTQQGCELVKPFEFCVPATKVNVRPAPTGPDVVGQPLRDDYVCYLAKCSDAIQPGDKIVSDQFGTRVERRYRAYKVCVPARKAPVGCSRSGSRCGGVCPNPGEDCRLDRTTKQCTCAPQECGGRPDSHGACGGNCATATDRCLPDSAGMCTCQPPPPPPCGPNTPAGACGGTCPDPTDKCLPDATGQGCACRPPGQPCASVAGGPPDVCGGDCPNATDTCGFEPTAGKCICLPPSCSPNPLNGQCGGSCPAGQTCTFMAGTAAACACR